MPKMIDLSLVEPIIDYVSLYFPFSGERSVHPRLLQLACSAPLAGSDESVLVLENHQRFGENCLKGKTPRVRINSCLFCGASCTSIFVLGRFQKKLAMIDR